MTRLRAVALCAVVSVLISVGAVGSDGSITVAEIVQRWAAANRADFKGSQQYNYSERIRDKDGTKTYDVAMLFGRPYKRLVMINGTPLGDNRKRTSLSRSGPIGQPNLPANGRIGRPNTRKSANALIAFSIRSRRRSATFAVQIDEWDRWCFTSCAQVHDPATNLQISRPRS